MKRKLAWVCLLVSPLVVAGAPYCLLPRDPISRANCDKIKKGMPISEVVAILGRDKDDVCFAFHMKGWGMPAFIWKGKEGAIRVDINSMHPPHFVDNVEFFPSEPRTIFGWLRNWLSL
jgi:hypothetical protein